MEDIGDFRIQDPVMPENPPSFGIFGQLYQAILTQNEISPISFSRLTPFITYCYSYYGISCMVMSLVLNRTMAIASTNTSRLQQLDIYRRRYSSISGTSELLKQASLVMFRIGAIGVLVFNAYNILVTLNLNSKLIGNSGLWIYKWLDSTGLFDYDIETAHSYMKTSSKSVSIGPSADLYWPVFLGFCLSTFMETFIAAINGQKPYTESGLTLFEHSLAFQEASSRGSFFLGNRNIVRKPTEELLVICLFSTLNHLNVQIGSMINDNKYRLIPSSIIGVSFLGYFTKLLLNGAWTQFPVIITGSIIPQLLIIGIILLSLTIFGMAIIATGLNFQDLNYASFFINGENDPEFQQRTFFKWSDDFYTTLLNLGLLALTSAGKSSYISELSIVAVDEETWLERSIWRKFKHNFENFGSTDMTSNQLIGTVKKGGYGNLIPEPSMELITGSNTYNPQQESSTVIKKRLIMLQTMMMNLYQLVKGLFFDKFLYKYILKNYTDINDETDDEDYDQFEKRKLRVPPFLRKFAKPKRKKPVSKQIVELDNFTEEEVSQKYIELFKREFSEHDTSIDFSIQSDNENDEGESEVEIDSEIEQEEFLSPHQLTEIIEEPSNVEILTSHLKYRGIMTRSKFHQLHQDEDHQDDRAKLIEILLSKRSGHLQKVFANPKILTEEDDFDKHSIDCVICQINPREIITWPCKCFSICESCRLTLASKGMEGCVCCRKEVRGVSKVFIP